MTVECGDKEWLQRRHLFVWIDDIWDDVEETNCTWKLAARSGLAADLVD